MKRFASHDTMTYLKPKSIWLRPFHFMAKTQKYDYKEQYEKYNARMFDIRIKYNTKLDIWEFAHGSMTFKFDGEIEQIFEYFNSCTDNVYLRMVLEYNRPVKNIEEITEKYIAYCDELKNKYANIIFFEYRRKYDWKQVYKYEGMPYPTFYQAISSMTGSKCDDLWPWLYARTHNKDNVEQWTDKEWLMLDFIGCYY